MRNEVNWNEVKVWTCLANEKHILGHVVRNGNGVRRLLIYRQAVDLDAEQPEAVDVIAVAEGTIFDVCCSICGAPRTWVLGQDGMKQLLARVQRQHVSPVV